MEKKVKTTLLKLEGLKNLAYFQYETYYFQLLETIDTVGS